MGISHAGMQKIDVGSGEREGATDGCVTCMCRQCNGPPAKTTLASTTQTQLVSTKNNKRTNKTRVVTCSVDGRGDSCGRHSGAPVGDLCHLPYNLHLSLPVCPGKNLLDKECCRTHTFSLYLLLDFAISTRILTPHTNRPSMSLTASSASRGSSNSMKANPERREKKWPRCHKKWRKLTGGISRHPHALQRSVSFEFSLQFWFRPTRSEITHIDTTRLARHDEKTMKNPPKLLRDEN